MTETREPLPATKDTSAGGLRRIEARARADERRSIGRRLHKGILQELTVAGLRLKALENGSTPGAIGEFAGWLRDRQSELRRYVAALEQGQVEDTTGSALEELAETLETQHDCRVSIDEKLSFPSLAPELADAVLRTIGEVAPMLAGALRARSIDIALDPGAEPTLRITHDGEHLPDRATELSTVRRAIGRNGGSLRLEAQEGTETLILDWTN